jgi:uncharacterized protein (TIGR03790 family)
MIAPLWGKQVLLSWAAALCSMAAAQAAIGPGNVLVLYNAASADGIELANYYALVHPGVALLGLDGVTTDEEVTADYYLNVIRPQILPALAPSISMLVTTKGLPLRIYDTAANPGTYVDPFGVLRTVGSGRWRPYSSLENELTRIDVISTPQQMGDQTYYSLTGLSQNLPQPARNPYYFANSPFDYNDYYIPAYGGMRLSARLDGFSTADVKAAINRANNAFLMPNSGYIVLDDDPSAGVDRMVQLRDSVLAPRGQRYVYDNTDAAVTTAPGPVIGYVSHGVNDGAGGLEPGYISGQLDFRLASGAVFHTHESYNAYSFQPGANLGGQGLVAQWLAIGGTAGVGHVAEPLSGATNVANEDQMFKMLLAGYTWGEAAWSSIQQLSYVNTVVGDPLMTWKRPAAGAVTYACPLYVGCDGPGSFTVGNGGTIIASQVQIGNAAGGAGVFNLAGGALDMSSPGDTLRVGVNGTLNFTSGTLNVDTIEVEGNGAGGGKVNAVRLIAKTLTVGPGATVTILPIAASLSAGNFVSQAGCVDSTGTTLIEDGLLQINTQTSPVVLSAVVGNGCLGVGDGIHPTTLIAQSIKVQSLTVGANSVVVISPLADPQLVNNSTSAVPEPGIFLLIATGLVWLRIRVWRGYRR